MNNTNPTTRGSWLAIATVALLTLPLLYVLSSGPMQLVRLPRPNVLVLQGVTVPLVTYRVIETRWDYRIAEIFAPLEWLEVNTMLERPLNWYWELFNRDPDSFSIRI